MIGITNALKKSSAGIVETINVTLNTNQQNHTDLIGVEFTLTYGDIEDTFKWKGEAITIEVPAFVNYSLSFNEVKGYLKPDNVSYEAQANNSRSVTFTYKAELVQVSVGVDNGSSIDGAEVTIDGEKYAWDGTVINHKVPFGKSYTISLNEVSGYSTPESKIYTAEQAVREVSFTYIASALKVNILSNQSTDSSWDPTITNIKATVSYDGASVEVSNGEQINLPSGVEVTISFPEVEGYLKPNDITFTHNGGLIEKSGTYKCELLTVNVSADQGSVSGFEVTISKQETVGVATKYTRLEYIESTGTQYIDTGIKGKSGLRVKMATRMNSASTTNNFFGVVESGKRLFLQYDSAEKLLFSYNTYNSVSFDFEANVDYEIDSSFNNGHQSLKIDNYECYTGSNSTELSMSINVFVGALNMAGTPYGYLYGRIYSCKIYDNDTLVRDYIPALRSDGIAGLYDAVNDTFTASSGSSNFIAGAFESTIIAKQTSATGTYKIPFDVSYTIEASKVGGYNQPNSITRVASEKAYTVSQQYKIITVRDLSMYDVYGNPIQQSTANCYVVREAGQYKFPLVFGNAIKNGKVNTAAFANNGGAYSHDFNFSQAGSITTPYIEKQYNASSFAVSIANTDMEGAINNLQLIEGDSCKYIQFSVNSMPQTGANIIISASHIGVVWSWHIWLWPHDLTPVEITNATGVKYNIMPVNLASKYDSDGTHIKNWFYQWGRPMPLLCPSAWNRTTDHTPGSITKESKASSLNMGIYAPHVFYYNPTYPYNWFGDKSYYNLWDAACTGTGVSDNDTVKTVYDPCPVGWKVPNGHVFTGLSIISNANGIVKMRRYSDDTVGVGFPLSGCRDNSDGSIAGPGIIGHVWSTASTNQTGINGFSFGSEYTYFDQIYRRSLGQSIRPVQDDNIQLDVIMISFTIDGSTEGMGVRTYQAESGMTWFEWIYSEYNTDGYFITGNEIHNNSYAGLVYTETIDEISPVMNIIGGAKYVFTE